MVLELGVCLRFGFQPGQSSWRCSHTTDVDHEDDAHGDVLLVAIRKRSTVQALSTGQVYVPAGAATSP